MRYWRVPRMWADGECWIIGGGISMPRQFGVPESVIEQVMAKEKPLSVYSEYLTSIHPAHVIATNVAYLLGPWISMLYFCDLPFYKENKYQLYDFKNLKITDTQNLPVDEEHIQRNIKRLKRDYRNGVSDYTDVIRYNKNAGGGAINLAVHLGIKRILLLGYDMKADEKGRTHWHSGLPNYRTPTNTASFNMMLTPMDQIAKDAKRRRVEILNINPDSNIDVFPKLNLKEVV